MASTCKAICQRPNNDTVPSPMERELLWEKQRLEETIRYLNKESERLRTERDRYRKALHILTAPDEEFMVPTEREEPVKKFTKLSGWGMFLKIKHGELKKEKTYSDRGMIGFQKKIGEMWKALTKEEQEKYKELARQENESNGIE